MRPSGSTNVSNFDAYREQACNAKHASWRFAQYCGTSSHDLRPGKKILLPGFAW